MRSMSAVSMFVVAAAVVTLAGCSTKPPRDVDAAVRHRLTRYSDAWKQGDAAGVRDSFVSRDADEAALLNALAQLAPAQAKLRTAYYESLGPTGRIIFGDGNVRMLVPGSWRWESYAQSAAHPYALVYRKPVVLAQLKESDKETIVPARKVDGGWKLELGGFVHGDNVPELTQQTHLHVQQTNEMTAAVRTNDAKEVQRVMLRHIAGMSAAATRPSIPPPPATRRSSGAGGAGGAKENPP